MTELLANQIDHLLAQIRQLSENRQELLLGDCESAAHLTSTQEHILMLLSGGKELTNAKISELLQISPAAVTKAVKKLLTDELILAQKDQADVRATNLSLAAKGESIAAEHASHHLKTLKVYEKLSNSFTASEQETISRFLSELSEVLR